VNFLITFINLFKILNNNKIIYLFYSEKKVYQNNFYKFIIELNKKSKSNIYYVSSEVKDKINLKGVINVYIGRGLARLFFFNYIKCKFFFITLTDLGNYYLKKSKKVNKYVYIFHSPISLSRSYTPKAFNNYDIFFSIGKKHSEELKKIFQNNNLKNKNIENIGYFYFDFLKSNIELNKLEKNTVLIAPSWNYNSKNFLNIDCIELIKCLLNKDYRVIFRPHPEHYNRSKITLQKIRKDFKGNKDFFFDNNSSNLDSIQKSEILITDNSGIAIEFCLILKRPIFYFESSQKLHNKNYSQISDITIEDVIKNEFGKIIRISDLTKIRKVIDEQRNYFQKELSEKLNDFVDNNYYNYSKSVDKAVNYIINIK
jgi:CDP-glycerol glycerophosphotransferase (TagB/SpsB family)